MKRFFSISIIILLAVSSAFAQNRQAVPFTLDDRDRLIKLEADVNSIRNEINSLRNEINSLRNEMNSLRSEMNTNLQSIDKQFLYQQKQMDDLKVLFYWGFGIMITLMIFMLGYMIWDRRTALKPALDKAEDVDYKTRNLISALREYARSHPDLADILRTNGLL
jgi:predicted PurR-regulated permease PerM